jgi:hypothetical protein
MANKLYEEGYIQEIADAIRTHAPELEGNRLFYLANMPTAIGSVASENRSKGKEELKDEEARTADNVNLVNNDVPEADDVWSAYIKVKVDSGYYAEDTEKEFRAADGGLDGLVDGIYEKGHNDGYNFGYTEGYNDGLAEGGGGDEPYDPTTVWLLNDVLVNTGSGIQGTTINVPFVSAGEEFVKITHTTLALNYYRSDGTSEQAWSSRKGWTSDDYKTITFPEEITDGTLQTWLDTNATLISGGGGGQDADISPEDSLTFMEQVQSPSVVYMSLYDYCFILDNFGAYGGRTIEDMIEIEYSDLNSNPLTISLINYTDMYAHYYIKATDVANDDQGHLVHIEALPQGDNSIDIVSQQTTVPACDWKIEVQGARFTKYA